MVSVGTHRATEVEDIGHFGGSCDDVNPCLAVAVEYRAFRSSPNVHSDLGHFFVMEHTSAIIIQK